MPATSSGNYHAPLEGEPYSLRNSFLEKISNQDMNEEANLSTTRHLHFDNFELQETKLSVRLINTTNERRLVQRHQAIPLKVTVDTEDFSSKLDNGFKVCTSWMKYPEFFTLVELGA
ncbi:hypothetical protein TNCV_4650801 [Trichonephila clavipes]|nr:hypothetical protein TNCV_4650801 [Trichonephila clavipes]